MGEPGEAADFRSISYKFFSQSLTISSQHQNNAVVAQHIYLKISEDSCCPAMQEDQGPANITGATEIAGGAQPARAEPSPLQIHSGMRKRKAPGVTFIFSTLPHLSLLFYCCAG